MKHAGTYRQLKPLYDRYRKSNDKEKFLRGHESEIILFEAAARELKRLGAVPLPTTESMKKELANLTAEKERLLVEYKAARTEAFSHKSANSFPTASQSWQFTHIPTTPTAAAIHPFLSNPNEKILWKFLFNGGTICTPYSNNRTVLK